MAEREASEEGEWKSESFAFAFNPCSIDREDCVIRIYVFYSKKIKKKRRKEFSRIRGSLRFSFYDYFHRVFFYVPRR